MVLLGRGRGSTLTSMLTSPESTGTTSHIPLIGGTCGRVSGGGRGNRCISTIFILQEPGQLPDCTEVRTW